MNRKVALIISIVFALSSCRSPYYLPKPGEFKQHVKGLHFEGTLMDGEKVEGEIIAIEGERLFLRPNVYTEIQLHTISKDILKRGKVVISLTNDKKVGITAAAAAVNILTLSHGYYGIFTMPLNLVSTVAISQNSAKETYRIRYPKDIEWEKLSKFARFPQGIPEGVELRDIK